MSRKKCKTSQEIVDQCNALARRFYAMAGYQVPEGCAFHLAHHPQERLRWALAREAFLELVATDPEDALSDLE